MSTATKSAHSIMHHEVVGHEVVADYVVYIVDIWEGDRTDPAVEVIRHTGVWRGSDLVDGEDNAIDPNFSKCTPKTYRSNSWDGGDPQPLMWDSLETPKKADSKARSHRDEALKWEDPEAYVGYGYSQDRRHKLYIAFLEAVDTLAEDPDNEEAWNATKEFLDEQRLKHEA